jgi:hypothetical protein
MRLLLVLALAIPLPVMAQQWRVAGARAADWTISTRQQAAGSARVAHMHRHMNVGTAFGAGAGLLYGLIAEPRDDDRRHGLIMTDVVVGASIGMLGGAATGLVTRARPRPRASAPPTPIRYGLERMSSYLGMGARLGAGAGVLHAAATTEPGLERVLRLLGEGMAGCTAGMLLGATAYFANGRR